MTSSSEEAATTETDTDIEQLDSYEDKLPLSALTTTRAQTKYNLRQRPRQNTRWKTIKRILRHRKKSGVTEYLVEYEEDASREWRVATAVPEVIRREFHVKRDKRKKTMN